MIVESVRMQETAPVLIFEHRCSFLSTLGRDSPAAGTRERARHLRAVGVARRPDGASDARDELKLFFKVALAPRFGWDGAWGRTRAACVRQSDVETMMKRRRRHATLMPRRRAMRREGPHNYWRSRRARMRSRRTSSATCVGIWIFQEEVANTSHARDVGRRRRRRWGVEWVAQRRRT